MLVTRRFKFLTFLFIFFVSPFNWAQSPIKDPPETQIQWQEWSDAAFNEAAREGKLILLDIGAKWCSFCKKMDSVTYQDPEVVGIISKNYIAIKADIETTEGVRVLYEHFGVPATIVLTPERKELNKRRGYIEPLHMQWHLLGVLQDT